MYSWFFMRISGLMLAAFAVIHLLIMHLFNNVDKINFNFVADRWANPAWRLYDLILLTLAVAHGGNGIRIIIDDYAQTRFWRTLWVTTLYTFGFVLYAIGVLTILLFQGRA